MEIHLAFAAASIHWSLSGIYFLSVQSERNKLVEESLDAQASVDV